MKQKNHLSSVRLIIATVGIAICVMLPQSYADLHQIDNPSDFIEHYNVYVKTIGQCRGIGGVIEDPPWHGGYYKGNRTIVLCSVNTLVLLDWLFIRIYNQTTNEHIATYFRVLSTRVGMEEASGEFYWSGEGNTASLIPPFIYISCTADIFSISK